jgi:hypothetical protein
MPLELYRGVKRLALRGNLAVLRLEDNIAMRRLRKEVSAQLPFRVFILCDGWLYELGVQNYTDEQTLRIRPFADSTQRSIRCYSRGSQSSCRACSCARSCGATVGRLCAQQRYDTRCYSPQRSCYAFSCARGHDAVVKLRFSELLSIRRVHSTADLPKHGHEYLTDADISAYEEWSLANTEELRKLPTPTADEFMAEVVRLSDHRFTSEHFKVSADRKLRARRREELASTGESGQCKCFWFWQECGIWDNECGCFFPPNGIEVPCDGTQLPA